MDCILSVFEASDYIAELRFTIDRDSDPEVYTAWIRVVIKGHDCLAVNGREVTTQGSDDDPCIAWDTAIIAAIAAIDEMIEAACP